MAISDSLIFLLALFFLSFFPLMQKGEVGLALEKNAKKKKFCSFYKYHRIKLCVLHYTYTEYETTYRSVYGGTTFINIWMNDHTRETKIKTIQNHRKLNILIIKEMRAFLAYFLNKKHKQKKKNYCKIFIFLNPAFFVVVFFLHLKNNPKIII